MLNSMKGKRVLLGVTGGIAAYKTPELIRQLRKSGAEVKVVMTKEAAQFVTELSLQALSGNPVATDLFADGTSDAMGHIRLARWADLILVAPATANMIAKQAHGLADDLLSTLLLAATVPLFIAPAMNQAMWKNPITVQNVRDLEMRGVLFLGPEPGEQACGEEGPGRMSEPEDLVASLTFGADEKLSNRNVVITAGPTYEDIDPVRFIGNRSSGKMGYALAVAAVQAGAHVTLISGPVALEPPARVSLISVRSAHEMLGAVMGEIDSCDIFIGAAAVADYRAAKPSSQKIKKSNETFHLELERNEDIIQQLSNEQSPPFIVGFAAETQDLEHHANEKLARKKMDMIVANQVGARQGGFDSDENKACVYWASGSKHFEMSPKTVLAGQLVELIARLYETRIGSKNT